MANLLLQVLFIIFPLFLYHVWIKSLISKESGRRMAFGVLCALMAIACITNPIQISSHLLFYITTVPWILSFVYGGLTVGLSVTLTMIVGVLLAVLLDIDYLLPFPLYFFVHAVSLSILMLLHSSRRLYKHRISSVIYMTMVNSFLLIAAHFMIYPDVSGKAIGAYVGYIALNVGCAWASAYLTEFFIEREKLVQEVQRAEKMNIVGQLAASVAHEVRNPMTVVRGFLQIMYDSPETTNKHRNYIALMLAEMDRAQDIITGYLSLAKPTAELAGFIDLNKVLASVKETIIPYAVMKNVHLTEKEEDGPFWVYGNEEKVKQVFLNMIKNAIEANPAGGLVSTTISRYGANIAVEIKDTGVGMSQEQLDMLGMPFYSTKEQGTGLGLMVCYSIINAMGGKITAESEKGMGTKFTILLPESPPQAAPKPPVSHETA